MLKQPGCIIEVPEENHRHFGVLVQWILCSLGVILWLGDSWNWHMEQAGGEGPSDFQYKRYLCFPEPQVYGGLKS